MLYAALLDAYGSKPVYNDPAIFLEDSDQVTPVSILLSQEMTVFTN